ncbi:MAG: 2-oxo acid dehydrogenase subunit E2 [Bacteroidales bacterium]|nr:2-oxo acid dehydrogenase subunit E2 [Bacteroidales bacterium]
MTKRKKRLGDRWDGYRLRGLDPVHVMMPYLFGNRTANEAVLGEVFDLTEVDKYLAAKNAENPEFKYTWFHFITAAIAKTIYLRPKMNYFIAGGHFYERDCIQVAFNVKRKFSDDAEEAMAKFVLDEEGESPMEQVHTYVYKLVTKVRGENKSVGVDDILKIVSYLPRFAWRIMAWSLRKMEYYGIYPKALAQDDPTYSSAYLTNLGSIKMNADYHHLFDCGTISFFVTIGEVKKLPFFKEDGTFELRNTIKLGLTIDERIADGYYFAKTLRLVRKIFENPQLLDLPASTPIEFE